MITENQYCAQLKAQTKVLYDSIKEVLCPYFNKKFVALVSAGPGVDIELKVVVRKIGDGPLHFCSIMPFKAPDYLATADPE